MNAGDGRGGIRARLIRGIKWTALQSVIVSANNFLTAVMLARLLGVDSFGAFSIIKVTGFTMATMAGAGLGVTVTKHIAEMRSTANPRLSRIIGLCSAVAVGTSFCFAAFLWLFADGIAHRVLHAGQIAGQLRLAAFYILFVTLNGYQVGALLGFESFSLLAKINLLQALFSFLLTFLLTFQFGLTGAVSSLGIAAFTNWALHQNAIRIELRKHGLGISYSRIWQEKGVLQDFTLPAAMSSLLGAFTVWGCNAFLTRQPDGLVQMGIFSAANNFRSFVLFVPGLVTHVASPILCNLRGKNNQPGYSRLFWTNIAVSACAAVFVAGVLVIFAPDILKLFGRDFGPGSSVAVVIAFMAVVEVMANAFYNAIFAHGMIWWQFRVVACWSTALGITTFTAVGQFGALGLAFAYLAAHAVSLSLYVFFTLKLQKGTRGVPTEETSLPVSE